MNPTYNFVIDFKDGYRLVDDVSYDFFRGFSMMWNYITIDGNQGNIEDYMMIREKTEEGLVVETNEKDWLEKLIIIEDTPIVLNGVSCNNSAVKYLENIMNIHDNNTFRAFYQKYRVKFYDMEDDGSEFVTLPSVSFNGKFKSNNLVAYIASCTDGHKVFILTECPSRDILKGMDKAVRSHGTATVKWITFIDISDSGNWKHSEVVF